MSRAVWRRGDRSRAGLDWLNFFAANVQTGFGAFISVFLTANRWTQAEIGFILSVGTAASMISQLPGGALVDVIGDKRLGAALAIIAIIVSALIFAFLPMTLPILTAEVLHGFASCMLTPAIAAISLTLTRAREAGVRFGRNARWAAIGSGVAAAAMGATGFYIGNRAVFVLTALLALPALLALTQIRQRLPRHEAHPAATGGPDRAKLTTLFQDRRLIAFAACALLFQLGSAAMLPIAAGEVTKQAGSEASLVIAACIVLPQLVVAGLSPWVGHEAEQRGRRILLMASLAAVPVRGLLFTLGADPIMVAAIQALDGISATGFGVLAPLIAADITRGTGRFNLCMGFIGLASGLGAMVSTAMAGAAADAYGPAAAFLALSCCGAASVLLVWLVMPETRPSH